MAVTENATVVWSLRMSGNDEWPFVPWHFVRVAFYPVAFCRWPFDRWPFVQVAFCLDPV